MTNTHDWVRWSHYNKIITFLNANNKLGIHTSQAEKLFWKNMELGLYKSDWSAFPLNLMVQVNIICVVSFLMQHGLLDGVGLHYLSPVLLVVAALLLRKHVWSPKQEMRKSETADWKCWTPAEKQQFFFKVWNCGGFYLPPALDREYITLCVSRFLDRSCRTTCHGMVFMSEFDF